MTRKEWVNTRKRRRTMYIYERRATLILKNEEDKRMIGWKARARCVCVAQDSKYQAGVWRVPSRYKMHEPSRPI